MLTTAPALILCILAGTLASWSPAAADVTLCPKKIKTEQRLSVPVPGYEAVATTDRHFWNVVLIYQGRPEERVSLHWDTDVEKPAHEDDYSWELDPKTEYWLECQYSGTAVVLWKKLPPVSQCTAIFIGNSLQEFACR
jgi:hypothetical protein